MPLAAIVRGRGTAAGVQREGQLVTALDLLAEEHRADDDQHEDDAADRRDDREDAVEAHHQERAGGVGERQIGVAEGDVPMPARDAERAGPHHEQRDAGGADPEQIGLDLGELRPEDLALEHQRQHQVGRAP